MSVYAFFTHFSGRSTRRDPAKANNNQTLSTGPIWGVLESLPEVHISHLDDPGVEFDPQTSSVMCVISFLFNATVHNYFLFYKNSAWHRHQGPALTFHFHHLWPSELYVEPSGKVFAEATFCEIG